MIRRFGGVPLNNSGVGSPARFAPNMPPSGETRGVSSHILAIGIDLGMTYSRVAVVRQKRVEIIANDHGNRPTPSCVAFTPSQRLIGDAALDQAAENPAGTIFHMKRLIGRRFDDEEVQGERNQWPFEIVMEDERPKVEVEYEGKYRTFSPEQLTSMVLTELKTTAEAYLGDRVSNAVVTVPAYFNEAQRQAMREAATMSGLNVLRIINEPTAAVLAYGFGKTAAPPRNVLVYGLGCRTFEACVLSVSEGKFVVKAVSADTHLGGENFDNRIVEYVATKFQRDHAEQKVSGRGLRRLQAVCEGAKRILSWSEEASIEVESLCDGIDLSATISRARFEHLCEDLFLATLAYVRRALHAAGMDAESIDDIILVGGSTRIPRIQKLVQDFFKGKELIKSTQPDETVVFGAAVQAAILIGDPAPLIHYLSTRH